MLDTTTQFSHVKEGQTPWRSDGLRDFFLYRDLGVAEATAGQVIAQLVKANKAPEKGTGWHRHEADFQIVIMLKGWARFMYGDQETLVAAGDCVHQRPGHRALPVRLLARHGVPGDRRPGGFQDRSTSPAPCAVPASDALANRRPAARQNSMSSSSISSGSRLRRGDPLLHLGQRHDASCSRPRMAASSGTS